MSACLMPAAYYSNTRWTPATTTGVHVTVEVEQGTLRGQEKISKFFPDDKYYSFEYIPYAKPPEGPLRFKEPQEPEPWTGVRDAFGVDELQAADTVPQKEPTTITDQFVSPPKVTDDCLYLDVDTPQLGDKRKPVIVWIHPLRFTEESAFGPQYFGVGQYMQEDVVLVTVRYRQNVLGFLCLDHEEVCCNAGLKDQVMALKWIQRNVSKFGGDPNNITLYGFGTAAAFVHYHLMSPLSEGLFHRVIIQGDCALNPHMYTPREIAIKRAFKLGKALDWDTDNTDDLLEFLKAVPVTDLVEAARKTLDLGENQLVFSTPFTPCVEVPATDKSFLPLPPRELLKQGRFAKVPIIMGTTNHVGRISLAVVGENEEVMYGDTDYESGTWGAFAGNPVGNETPPEWMKDVQNVYFGHKPSKYDVPGICGKLLCDFAYHYGCDESIRTQLENTEQPIYAFEFRLFCVENPMKPLMYGDTHRLYRDNIVYSGLIKMWTSFAKTSDPNYEGMEVTWEPARRDSFCYLQIQAFLRLFKERISESRLLVWDRVFEKYPEIKEEHHQIYMFRVAPLMYMFRVTPHSIT